MAVETVRRDDLDRSEGAEPVFFGLDGQWYAIDLGEENRKRLAKALEPFIKAATAMKSAPPKRRATSGPNGSKLAQVRAWAKANGYEVGEKGRIPKEVQDAYDEAHPTS